MQFISQSEIKKETLNIAVDKSKMEENDKIIENSYIIFQKMF